MIEFAEHLNFDDYTRELALESYTELLDLLDFMRLPEVLRRQAGVLMNLVTVVLTGFHVWKAKVAWNPCSHDVFIFLSETNVRNSFNFYDRLHNNVRKCIVVVKNAYFKKHFLSY